MAGGLAILRVLGEGACDDGVDRVGQVGVVCPDCGRLGLEVLPEDAHRRAALVRWLTGQAFVQDAAERVDVGAAVDGAAFDLLGGDVVDGAERVAGGRAGVGILGAAGEPEVAEVGVLVGREQDVGGLDVAVDQAVLVRGVERVGDL